jgi:hypothetical protein
MRRDLWDFHVQHGAPQWIVAGMGLFFVLYGLFSAHAFSRLDWWSSRREPHVISRVVNVFIGLGLVYKAFLE